MGGITVGTEQFASVNGVSLCFETFGDPDDPALLLIMGLGGQMIWWDDELCRQLAAALAAPDRTPVLRDIRVPTVVIHGAADRLITASGGKSTAAAIPGAKLVTIRGMAHDMPEQVWPQLISEITENARRASLVGVSR